MKKLLILLLMAPAASLGQSPFDGTWIIENDAQLPEKPTVYSVAKGTFRCSGCIANGEIKADGRDQKVEETSYWDTISVRIVDTHTVEITAKKAGKTMFTEVDTVSPDGSELTQMMKDTTEGRPTTVETLSKRVDEGTGGSHALSGSWQAYRINRSKNGATITYKCTIDGFSAETPLGERFDAKFDGKEYPLENDPGHTMVSVKLLSPRTIEITSKRHGKVVGILRLSVVPDGRSIRVVFENKESDATSTYEMQKQP